MLQQRCMQIILKLLYELLNNMIDFPEFLQNINFIINPMNTLNLFYVENVRKQFKNIELKAHYNSIIEMFLKPIKMFQNKNIFA